MKKLTAIILTVCMIASLVSVFTFTASAGDLVSVTDICDYWITTKNVGLDHYRDAEGEEKLFDGVIPTTEELNAAVQEAKDSGAEDSLLGWFQWKGWIGIHSTGADSYITNKAVDVNFKFDEPVALKKIVVHCAAMEKGNVWIGTDYKIYTSEDGVTWSTDPIVTTPTEYKNGEAVNNINQFDDTVILLDEAVTTQYFKLVADGIGCWWFCSEVEIYAEDNSTVDVDESSAEASTETSVEASEDETGTETGIIDVAKGKTYTLSETEPRNDGWDDNGTKLTDGVKVRDDSGSTDIDGFLTRSLEAVIDLGEITSINGFNADAFGNDAWGISSPSNYTVEFLYSADGTDYTSAGTVLGTGLTPVYGAEGGWVAYEFTAEADVEARYVKVVYTVPEDKNGHLWISEIEVLANSETDTPSDDNSGSETPDTGDAGIVALAIFSVIALAGAAVIKKK